jgi:hypothetical protein
MKKWLFAFVALGVLIAQPHRASAAITASLSIVGPSSYNGCPVTVQFTGTIAGKPGTAFTYSYNRFINGAQTVVNGGTTTIPAGGSITVNDAISVSSSAMSNTFDQLWVHGISGGQSDVYSNEADFAVNCMVATPTPGQMLGPAPTPPPIPNGLSSTNDPQVCTLHGGFAGGLACTGGFSTGMLALIWSSNAPNGCGKCIEGYNVYRVDGGQHTFVVRQSNGEDVTLALLDKPSDGFNGKCYAVRSYVGFGESSDSGQYCVSGPVDQPAVHSFQITPNAIRSVNHGYHFHGPGLCDLPAVGTGPELGLSVGFFHNYSNSAGFTCDEDTVVQQTAVSFELGSAGILLRNPKASVQKAILAFNRVSGGNAQCVGGVRLPTGDWSNAKDLIPNKEYIVGIPWSANGTNVFTPTVKISGPIYNIDVTSAINNFAKGVWPDHGFLLVGGNEATIGFHDNDKCDSQFGDFSLSLQVIVQP